MGDFLMILYIAIAIGVGLTWPVWLAVWLFT